jgi:toxic protein SymE
MKSSRRLKIRSKFRQRTWETVPQIKLEGRWLEHLGFKEGQIVEIEEEEEKITITVRQSCLNEVKQLEID